MAEQPTCDELQHKVRDLEKELDAGRRSEVYQKIGKNHPETRVLHMSGYPGQSLMQDGVQFEAVPLLQKPLMIRPLLEKVAECLKAN